MRAKSRVVTWLKGISVVIFIVILARLFVFLPTMVDGNSMQPTLNPGNRMMINQLAYAFSEPDRFDIVVFLAPGGQHYIKRVIGLPGEELMYKGDVLYINGEPQSEPYLEERKQSLHGEQPLTGDFTLEERIGKKKIPADQYFVMGDNRRLSKDSRDIGLISAEDIIGETSIVFYPFEEIKIVK
ncbi:signal peptidase I [Bacillus sp. FSL W7-1360]